MIIAITGKKYSGKDTGSDYLVQNYGFIKYSFATPLKEVCKILFDFNDQQLFTNKKEEIDDRWGVTPRKVLQFMGTDLLRNNLEKLIPGIGDNFWVKLFDLWRKKQDPSVNIVVSDLRFENEVKYIHDNHGFVIRIDKKNNDYKDDHESESGISKLKVNVDIENNKTKKDFYKKLDAVMESLSAEIIQK